MLSKNLKYFFLFLILYASFTSCNQKNQIANVQYSFSGCFASGKSQLIIYKKDGYVRAMLEENGAKKYETIINSSQIGSFNLFIRELKNHNEEIHCTTVEFYIVKLKSETIKREMGDCMWDGFSKIINILFNLKD